MHRTFRPGREKTAGTAQASIRPTRVAIALVAVMVTLRLAACSDESPPEPQAPAAAETGRPAVHQLTWVRVTDGIAPEQWLASREAGRDLEPDEPAVRDMTRILEIAAKRFRDQPRMIANRAVQLEGMLSEKRISERAPRLIVTISQVPGAQRSVESFAALTQQYYNLRLEGLAQGPAIDALKRQYARTPAETDAR